MGRTTCSTDVAGALVLLDALQRLGVADGRDRFLEGVFDGGLQEGRVPSARHASHRVGHLLHARLVGPREQVGKVNQHGGDGGASAHQAGLDERPGERHVR